MSIRAIPDLRQSGPRGRPAGASWRRWAWPAGCLLSAIALFFCYLRLSGTQKVTSDGASMALQAWDMLHGNLLLHGWTVADVTFWATELPEYMLIELLRGLGASDVHVAAALTYTLLVLLAALVAKGRATGAKGLTRALIAAGIMIAPQLGQGTLILLLAPDHTGTGVPLLLAWLALDRFQARSARPAGAGRPDRGFTAPLAGPLLVGLLLTWALLGDPIVKLTGVAPLALVCAIVVYRGVVCHGEPWRRRRFELSLIAAAAGAFIASDLILKAVAAFGGFRLAPVNARFAGASAMPGNLWKTIDGVLALYGADFFGLPWHPRALLAAAHLAGLSLAALAVCITVRNLPRPGSCSASGSGSGLGSGSGPVSGSGFGSGPALGAGSGSGGLGSYSGPGSGSASGSGLGPASRTGSGSGSGFGSGFGLALGPTSSAGLGRGADSGSRSGSGASSGPGPGSASGDLVAGVLAVGLLLNLGVYLFSTMPVTIWSTREIAWVLPAGAALAGRLLGGRVLRARLAPLLAVVAVVCLAALGYGMTQPRLPAEGQDLADWLRAHHLTNGLTGYGFGPTTTLASGGRVELRQAAFSPGRVAQGPEEQQRSWYDPSAHDATFLVLAAHPGPFAPLTPVQARATFGPPAHAWRVAGQFLVWTYRTNLLTRVH